MDVGYRAGQTLSMVLLDWEKAFDKVDQGSMHEALERMNIPENTDIIKEVYKNPSFKIEIDGEQSEWQKPTIPVPLPDSNDSDVP